MNVHQMHVGFVFLFANGFATRLLRVDSGSFPLLLKSFRGGGRTLGVVPFAEEEDCCLKDALSFEIPSLDLTVDFPPWSCCFVKVAVYFH